MRRVGRRYILLEGPSLMDLENIGGACGGPVLEFVNIGGPRPPPSSTGRDMLMKL